MADGALLAALIFSIDLAVDEVLAILVVLIDNCTLTTNRVARAGHGTIADAKFFQHSRRW